MAQHEFTLLLDRNPEDEDFDALFNAGLDDTTPEYGPKTPFMLHVHRNAPTLNDAITSAVQQTSTAGFNMLGILSEDVISLKTIATRLNHSYESVRKLANGDRGPGGFPAPVTHDNWALYSWVEVTDWFNKYYINNTTASDYDRTIAAADHLIRANRLLDGEVGTLLQLAS